MTARVWCAAAVVLLLTSSACKKEEAPAQAASVPPAKQAIQPPLEPPPPANAGRKDENPLLDDREFEVQVGINDSKSSKALATWAVETLRKQGYRVSPEANIGRLPDPARSKVLLLVNLLELSAGCRVSVEGTKVLPDKRGELVFAWGSENGDASCERELKQALSQFIAKVPPTNPPKSR